MGWIKKIKNFIRTDRMEYFDMMSGNVPIFSNFGEDIYTSDVVKQAIQCIAQEMSKLHIQHIKEKNSDPVPQDSDIQNLFNDPNPIMTINEFIEKIVWTLYLNYNAFIVLCYDEYIDRKTGKKTKRYTNMYPISPTDVTFLEASNGDIYVEFRFQNGETTTLNYNDVIHLKYRYSVNELMGGDENGKPDNAAILRTVTLNDYLMQGVTIAMKSSCAVNGVVKYNSIMDNGKLKANLDKLEKQLQRSESGFLPLDMKAEFIPIQRSVKLVDKDTLEFIDSKILRNFGVSLPILTGDYTKEQYEAFYQKTLEPLIIALANAFTKKLFDYKKRRAGNRIEIYPKELIFLSTAQAIEMIRLLGDSGTLYENEKRRIVGLKPLPELEGKRLQSLNYVDATIAKQYQGGEKNG